MSPLAPPLSSLLLPRLCYTLLQSQSLLLPSSLLFSLPHYVSLVLFLYLTLAPLSPSPCLSLSSVYFNLSDGRVILSTALWSVEFGP